MVSILNKTFGVLYVYWTIFWIMMPWYRLFWGVEYSGSKSFVIFVLAISRKLDVEKDCRDIFDHLFCYDEFLVFNVSVNGWQKKKGLLSIFFSKINVSSMTVRKYDLSHLFCYDVILLFNVTVRRIQRRQQVWPITIIIIS